MNQYSDNYLSKHVSKNALDIWEIGASNAAAVALELHKQICYWRNQDNVQFNCKDIPEIVLIADQLDTLLGLPSLPFFKVLEARDSVKERIDNDSTE